MLFGPTRPKANTVCDPPVICRRWTDGFSSILHDVGDSGGTAAGHITRDSFYSLRTATLSEQAVHVAKRIIRDHQAGCARQPLEPLWLLCFLTAICCGCCAF